MQMKREELQELKVILLAAISADGKIAEQQGQTSLDWTSKEDTRFFVEKTKEVGVVIMGRKTFETFGKPLKGRRLIVLSRQERTKMTEKTEREKKGTVEFTNEELSLLLSRLQNEGHDAVVVAGGASVYSQFLKQRLVTELFLTIEPVLFGQGISFASDFERVNMKLIETRLLGEQSVLLHYVISTL